MYNFFVRFDNILNPKRMAYAWITGSTLWLAWLLSISFGPGYMDMAGQVVGTDYLQFHAAGLTIRLGESARLYDFEFQSNLELQIVGPELVFFHAFITPPFLAYIFVPLSYFPYPLSFVLWSAFGLISLYLSIRWLKPDQSLKPFLWSLTFFPVFATISFGQNSLLSLFLLTLSYVCWRKHLPFLAGLVSSILLYKPQLVLGIGLLWLLEWRKDWKALLGIACGTISLAGICVVFLPEASLAYLNISRNFISSMMSSEQFPIWHAHSWRAFWYLLFPNRLNIAEFLWIIFSAFGLAGFLLFWRKHREEYALLYAGAICLTIWISPHAMIYDWTIMIIPAILLWEANDNLIPIRKSLYAALWIALLISGPLTVAQLKLLPIAIQISLPIYGIIIMMVFKILMYKPSYSNDTSRIQNLA